MDTNVVHKYLQVSGMARKARESKEGKIAPTRNHLYMSSSTSLAVSVSVCLCEGGQIVEHTWRDEISEPL